MRISEDSLPLGTIKSPFCICPPKYDSLKEALIFPMFITESVDDLQEVANRWYQAADGNEMKKNTRVGKTEVMMISRRREECNINMGNVKLNQTANYSYLGVNIDEENRKECEVDSRIA